MLINNPVDTEYAELSTQAICIFKEKEVYDLISRIALRSNSAAAPQSRKR